MIESKATIIATLGLLLATVGIGCSGDTGGHAHDAHSHSQMADAGDGGPSFADYTTDRQTATDDSEFFVTYEPTPDPIPTSELFELDVRVYASSEMESMVDASALDIEAEMPTHGHGMNTAPEVTREATGRFRVRGMKFHMPSDRQNPWVMRVSVEQGDTTDVARFQVITREAD
jgi:hypothetical protein